MESLGGVVAGLVNGSSTGVGMESVNSTVGTGPAGFGGLSWKNALSRWIQASEAPDLVLPEIVKMAQPIFFFLMFVEFCASKYLGKRVFYLRQTCTNLGAAGTMYLILGIFLRGLIIFPYMVVHNLFGLNKSEGFWTCVMTFFGSDLTYYLAHRWGHVSNSGWALHNMHHSSPDFNMITAYRLPPSLVINWLFYLPLAFFVPVKLFFIYYGALHAYQFLTHTELVGKLHPVIEYIFNTPSHHRVHHGRNYPRANYGGTLIIWDRLFNTFVPERDDKPCVYGLDERQIPLGTHNPVWQQGHHIWYTMKGVLEAKGFFEKLRVLCTRVHVDGMIAPATTDSNEDTVPMPPDGIPCDPRVSWVDPYVAIHGGLCLLVSLYILIQAAYLPLEQTTAICFGLLFSYTTMFTLMDESEMEKAAKNETFRLVTVAALGIWLLSTPLSIALSIFCLVSIAVVRTLSSENKLDEDQKHSDLDVDHFYKLLQR